MPASVESVLIDPAATQLNMKLKVTDSTFSQTSSIMENLMGRDSVKFYDFIILK